MNFDFKKFIDDSKMVLISPWEYFASMAKEGGLGEPVIKALLYGAVGGIISMIFSIMGLTAAAGAFGSMAGGGIGIMILIRAIVGAVIGLFIGGVIMLVVSAICGGKTDYEANVRVVASLMVLWPVMALLGFLGRFHFYLGVVVILGVSLYGLYLMYVAEVKALEGKEPAARVVSIVLAIIPLIMLLSILLYTSRNFDTTGIQKYNQMKEQNEMTDLMNSQFMKKAMEEAQKSEQESGAAEEESR